MCQRQTSVAAVRACSLVGAAAFMAFGSVLTGCGQKGPLRLPPTLAAPAGSADTPSAPIATPAPPPASAASAPR